MATGLPRNMFRNLRARINQYEATTGRRVSKAALQALMESELDVMSARAGENARLEESKRQFGVSAALEQEKLGLTKQQMEDAAQAAKVSGVTQLVGSGAQLAMLNRMLPAEDRFHPIAGAKNLVSSGVNKIKSGKDWLSGTPSTAPTGVDTGGALGPGGMSLATGGELAGYGESFMGAEAGFAPGSYLDMIDTINSQAGATLSSVPNLPSGMSTVPLSTWAGAAGAAYGVYQTRENIREGQGIGAKTVRDITPWNDKTGAGSIATTIIAAPFAAGAAVVDIVTGGSVICTVLYEYGYMPKAILILDGLYRHQNIDDSTYSGYLWWAKPIVDLMYKHEWLIPLIAPFGKAWAWEMAHRVEPAIPGSLLGRALNYIGIPLCKWLGRRA